MVSLYRASRKNEENAGCEFDSFPVKGILNGENYKNVTCIRRLTQCT